MVNELHRLRKRINELEYHGPHKKRVIQPLTVGALGLSTYDLLIGINPVCAIADEFSIHDEITSSNTTPTKAAVLVQKPNIFVFLLKQEPGSQLFWKERPKRVFNFKNLLATTALNKATNGSTTSASLQKVAETFGPKFIPLPDHLSQVPTPQALRAVNDYGKYMGLVLCTESIESDTVLIALKKILPGKDYIFMLINRFFQKLYFYFPVLDENTFKAAANKILKFSPEGAFEGLFILNKNDLGDLVVLLLVIRLSYLTVFRNVEKQNRDLHRSNCQEAYIIENPIPLEVVDIVDKCLKEFNVCHKPSMSIIQAFIFRYIYRMYSPEEGTGPHSNDLQVSLGSLISMAYAMELNREPDGYPQTTLLESEKAIRRKLWYYLLQQDRLAATSLIYNSMIRNRDYDVIFPKFSEEGSNIADFELERKVINSLELLQKTLGMTYPLVERLNDKKTKITVNELLSVVNDLELFINESYGKACDYIDSSKSEGFLKVLKFTIYLHLKIFLSFLYQFLYIYYEKREHHHFLFFFYKKMVTALYNELNPLSKDLLHYCDRYFPDTFTLITSPIILMYGHVLALVASGMTIRFTCTYMYLTKQFDHLTETETQASPQELELIHDITQLGVLLATRKMMVDSVIGYRYFYAWKCKKAKIYGYSLVKSSDIYTSSPEKALKARLQFSLDHMKEMKTLLSKCTQSTYFHESLELDLEFITPVDFEDPSSIDRNAMDTIQNDNFWIHLGARHQESDKVPSLFQKDMELSNLSDNMKLPDFADGFELNNPDPDLFGMDWTFEEFFRP